jgi:hypothetical protein
MPVFRRWIRCATAPIGLDRWRQSTKRVRSRHARDVRLANFLIRSREHFGRPARLGNLWATATGASPSVVIPPRTGTDSASVNAVLTRLCRGRSVPIEGRDPPMVTLRIEASGQASWDTWLLPAKIRYCPT